MTYWLGVEFAFAAAISFDKNLATIGNVTMVVFSVVTDEEMERHRS